jgi:SAM-dependent methyltransferase
MGRFTRVAGAFGGEVIGIDLSESVFKAYQVTKELPFVHIIQGNILQLPFQDRSFDIIYSLGVLHHTPETKKSFSALTQKLKHGGTISIWVYGTAGSYQQFVTNPLKENRAKVKRYALVHWIYWLLVLMRENASNVFRKITVHLPHPVLYRFCYGLAWIGKIPFVKYLAFSAHKDFRARLIENFDWLSPPYQHHHTKEEVMEWFRKERITPRKMLAHGFIPKVGIKGTLLQKKSSGLTFSPQNTAAEHVQ